MIQNILLQFIFGLIFFGISVICFTFPGYFLLKKIKLEFDDILEKYTLSTVLGLVVFTLAAYLLAALHLRFLMWVFPVFGVITFLSSSNLIGGSINNFIDSHFRGNDNWWGSFKISHKKLFILVLVVGIVAQVAVNAPSGIPYKDGIYFWSSHGHDGVWHSSLMESMKRSEFPFQNPELAGQKLQNYHFFVDLLMSEIGRLFNFSNLDIYFRFMPTLFSILLGLASFIFVRSWKGSEVAGIWAMIFTYFAGSFGYFLYVPTHGSLGGESIFWVSQTHSVLGNPPHASAFIILTVFLFCLLKYFRNYDFKYFLLCFLLGGAIIEFKVYGGILILFGLLVLGIIEIFVKRTYKILLLFLSTFLLAFGIYYPNSINSQDFLIWQPWWYIRTMVVAPDRLNWLDLELRRQHYLSRGTWNANLRVVQLETTAFLIFLFGNLGMRFLGFWTIFKQLRKNIFRNSFNLFFLVITITSFLIPVLFLQKGVAWNSIQFNQYFLLLFGFLASLAVTDLLSRIKKYYIKVIMIIIIIFLAVPTQAGLLWQFYSNAALSKISYQELEALDFLKQTSKKNSVILTAPFNKYEKEKFKNPPIPIYTWYDTGYVSAFSERKTLISDEEQINIMGYDVRDAVKEREEAFKTNDANKVNEFLTKFNINYIYLAWDQKFATDSGRIKMDLIFANKEAKVYQVKHE